MNMEFQFGGVYLNREDFDNSLRDYIAFSIAFAANTQCRDKDAALELLRYEAARIIECVKAGKMVSVVDSLVCECGEMKADASYEYCEACSLDILSDPGRPYD